VSDVGSGPSAMVRHGAHRAPRTPSRPDVCWKCLDWRALGGHREQFGGEILKNRSSIIDTNAPPLLTRRLRSSSGTYAFGDGSGRKTPGVRDGVRGEVQRADGGLHGVHVDARVALRRLDARVPE